ncbi:MAG: methylenetetrahydrofolate reductase [NAD(P)H] [Flavobacteriales bacterium]|jgi:methylenetetrahydrofolate reductase (NADPH)|nr:methylenetetrahydrofolate reductase [NAD(P)H] [Flavobacteriales bacterium]MBT5698749.1 methylenetetrahydrofolate reductase [NAD(P)H] [Flavobacteriales bacterium]MBT6816056.1 methylenetetrahydrofolate reductase [NAD(P)H] [Flavobacteriales bacterium]
MKVIKHLENAKQTLFSFEILPPLKGKSIDSIYNSLDPLMEYNPPFIDVTYHREEYVYKNRKDGLLERISVRKRPGTVGICAAIMNKYNVDTVPHIICGGFNKEETENALIDLDFLGIDNVLVLRGDPIKSETYFTGEEGGHKFASGLLKQVDGMNNGVYLDEELKNSAKTDFCIGVAGYPEKHFEAANMRSDIHFLKKKVEAGADYIVTQMFFDNQKYYDFVKLCRENDINIPIIPGLKPMSTEKQLTLLPQRFHLNVPNELVDEVLKCKSNEDVRQVGVEWAINQTKELIDFGAPCIHFYTMGKSDNVQKIVGNFV